LWYYLKMKANKPKQSASRVDRSAFSVVALSADDGQRDYWREQTPEARLRHVLELRRLNYGAGATGRLQRVFDVAEFPSD
jgi:hypothetical protein